MRTVQIPELALVVLIGPSGSGKSTFARKHFAATEILSSDYFRGLVADNENDQTSTKDAFEILHFIARNRLVPRQTDTFGLWPDKLDLAGLADFGKMCVFSQKPIARMDRFHIRNFRG